MIEFLNYVPPEGSIGELLIKLIPGIFTAFVVIFGLWLFFHEVRKSME